MNKYYKTLELDKILERLSGIAENDETKAMIRGLLPAQDRDTAQRRLAQTSAAFDLLIKCGMLPSYKFKDIRGLLDRAKSGSSLTPAELLDVALMLRQTGAVYDYRTDAQTENNLLDELFYSLSPQKWLEDRIRNAILSEDEIADTASEELARIRQQIAKQGRRIRESLDKMLKNSEVQKHLTDTIVTQRDGRFVIPVKADSKGSVRGIVHAASASGNTLFIEPEDVVEANNEIRVLEGMERAEIERIIAALSADVASVADAMERDFSTVAELLFHFCKAELGARMKASVPALTQGVLELKRARHPLLDPKTAVPVDISLGGDRQVMIITGPNTGGKTVSLKTAGLLTAMAACGLMIPAADGSSVPLCREILADIGDMQSIEMNLSTFSSHMSNIVEILGKAGPDTLVLLDELGGGTDPVEGAALATAVTEKLIEMGSIAILTTHYQELKVFALEHERVENASCEFDTVTMQPTYRLITGAPGKSNAFTISERLGMDKGVIARAKELINENDTRFERAVEQLDDARRRLDVQTEELSRLKAQQAQLVEDYEKKLSAIEASRDAQLEKARTESMRIIENCRIESDKLLEELREMKKAKTREEAERLMAEGKTRTRQALDRMYETANPIVGHGEEYTPPRPFRKGDRVKLADTGKAGVLAADPDASGNVMVQIGAMRAKVNVSKLRLSEETQAKEKKKSPKAGRAGVAGAAQRSSSLEVDIRGCAVDEGIHEVDSFIDNAVLINAGIVTIIHGKGTGLLRQGIQRHLRTHPSVKSFRSGVYGEGEDGVTIVELK